jgi:NADH:ubiquinone oxidoreductase subunit 4 (subunit M)
MPDVDGREMFYLVPLALGVIFLGVAPGYVMDRIGPSVEKLRTQYEAGLLANPIPYGAAR